MNDVELILPYPPSVNHYKNTGRLIKTKKGRMYQPRVNSPETKKYYWDVFIKVHSQKIKSFAEAKISVEIDVYPPDKRKRDLDGILKVLLDSMQKAGLYDDDCQIARLLVERREIIEQGQVVVTIKEFQNA